MRFFPIFLTWLRIIHRVNSTVTITLLRNFAKGIAHDVSLILVYESEDELK